MSTVSWLVAAACVLANAAAIAALLLGWRSPAPRRYAMRALIAGGALPVLGFVGTVLGLKLAFAAVATATPESKATMLAQGISEAMNATAFTLVASLLPLAIAVALFLRGAPKRESAGSDPAPSA
jgi:hypothetical protein